LHPRVPAGRAPYADRRGVRLVLHRRRRSAGMSSAWRVTALHHVAMAHGDDAVCEDAMTMLLGGPTHSEHGPGFLERMYPVGGSYVQTLEADGDGLVQRFMDRRGPGLHHVAFTVDAIDA